MHWARVSPGEVVAEIGAGSCWLSHILNRYGCRTVSIDVSPTALALGRKLFERDTLTNWKLEPRFVSYDGHALPLNDASVDRIIISDAFHHIPNQRKVLGEMARILKDGGIAVMSEPGRNHADAYTSRMEMDETGVLENNIIVEDLEPLALSCGFSRMRLVPLSLPQSLEIAPSSLADFMRGRAIRDYWRQLSTGLVDHHYIVLYKGAFVPTTRSPQRLDAAIELLDVEPPIALAPGQTSRLDVRISNRGDTRWLSEMEFGPGWTGLGAHLYATGRSAAIAFDWFWKPLPRDLMPGESVELKVELPAIDEPGSYRIVFDMITEGVMWFAQGGSPTTELDIEVAPPRG